MDIVRRKLILIIIGTKGLTGTSIRWTLASFKWGLQLVPVFLHSFYL